MFMVIKGVFFLASIFYAVISAMNVKVYWGLRKTESPEKVVVRFGMMLSLCITCMLVIFFVIFTFTDVLNLDYNIGD